MTTNRPCWLLSAFVMFATLATCQPANAQTHLYAGAWSKHLLTDDDYNETHNLAAVEHKRAFSGYFKNSYDRDSFAVGYSAIEGRSGDFEAKLILGAVYGYTTCYGDDSGPKRVCPLAVPMVSYTKYRVQPTLMLMGEAVAFSVRVALY